MHVLLSRLGNRLKARASVTVSERYRIVKTKYWLQLGEKERKEGNTAPPWEARMEMIYEHSFGTREKCVPLILRIMFGKSLDILKYGTAAQIKRVEMDVMESEGDSAVPQISFPLNTQNLS